jgi:hypothetical protein
MTKSENENYKQVKVYEIGALGNEDQSLHMMSDFSNITDQAIEKRQEEVS